MQKNKSHKEIFPAVFAGVLNGFFGTGGGVPLYFSLARKEDDATAYATASVGVLILSLQTLFLYRGAAVSPESVSPFLPFLAVVGGTIGTRLLGKTNAFALRLIFGILLLISGGYTVGKEIYLAFS